MATDELGPAFTKRRLLRVQQREVRQLAFGIFAKLLGSQIALAGIGF
jgi:hypothetical protein